MFNNDVTKTYELTDATFEILIMLAGAFLLGALFSWALGKLRGNKTNRKHYQRKTVDQQNGFRQPTQQAGASYPDDFDTGNIAKKTGAAAILGGSAAAIGSGISNAGSSAVDGISGAASGAGSKLAKAGSAATESLSDTGSAIKESASDAFSSVGDRVSDAGSAIKETASNGISSAGDTLSNAGSSIKENTSDTISSAGDSLSEVGSSIHNTASDALDSVGNKVSDAQSDLSDTVNEATLGFSDDFKKIEGIGSKIESALHTAGVKTYADLRASDNDTLKTILNAASPAFNMHDPETWPYQADLAYNGKWKKLDEYQNFLMGRDE